MNNCTKSLDAKTVKESATGRWPEILQAVGGIPSEVLDGKHHPCPKCGGEDRFRLIDVEAGAALCNQCFNVQNGDGIAAVRWSTGLSFRESLERIAEYCGIDNRGKHTANGKVKPKSADKSYATASETMAALESFLGQRTGEWSYHDALGEVVGMVLRFETANGKTIRPIALRDNRWVVGGMPEPRPIYNLPEVIPVDEVFIVEGEKCVEALRSIGLVATTSPSGCSSATKADWSPLAGKKITILPDHDGPGEKYAGVVLDLLQKLKPMPAVRVVRLDKLPNGNSMPVGGDVVDWIDGHGDAATPEVLVENLRKLIDTTEVEEAPLVEESLQWKPFPSECLPSPLRQLVEEGAAAIGCDKSYIALPLLSATAAAIGTSRCLRLGPDWFAPAVLWTAIVGESGTSKTPAFSLALESLSNLQRKAHEENCEADLKYVEQEKIYKKALSKWEKSKEDVTLPPAEPIPPQRIRYIIGDATTEAMVSLLQDNPRGLLSAREELNGWLQSFGQYNGKAGADASMWLTMHGAKDWIYDRKTGFPRTIFLPRASVGVTGGIQPGVFRRSIGDEHRESGMLARILLAFPPRKKKKWTEDRVGAATKKEVDQLFQGLVRLEAETDEDDRSRPAIIKLSPDAKKTWIEFFDAHASEQVELAGHLSAAWSKLEETAARIALVFHLVKYVAGDLEADGTEDSIVGLDTMREAIELTTWFKREVRRVYEMFDGVEEDRDLRRLIEWIEAKGGRVTTRDVQQGCRWLKGAGAAEAALNDLVQSNLGVWEVENTATKPRRVFRLSTASTSTDSPKTRDSGESVDVDSVDACKTKNAS